MIDMPWLPNKKALRMPSDPEGRKSSLTSTNHHTTVRKALCPFCLDPDCEGDAVTHEVLQGQHCHMPGCRNDHEHLYLTPWCHLTSGMDSEYCKRHGVLTLVCHECGQLTAAFSIAKR